MVWFKHVLCYVYTMSPATTAVTISHDFGHRGRNGVTVTQRRGTGSTNVARRGCRDRRDRFLNSQKICHGSHGEIDLLKCALV